MTRADIGVSALALLLAGLVVTELRLGLDPPVLPDAAPASGLPIAPAGPGAFVPPPPEAFDATLARPLFVPERRPAASAGAAPAMPAGLRLIGIITTGGRMSAVLRSADGRTHTLREGEAGPGWAVLRIASGRVTIEDSTGRHDLTLSARQTDPAVGVRPPAGVSGAAPGVVTLGQGEVRYR